MSDKQPLAEWIEQVNYALDRSVDGPMPEGEMWDLIVPMRDLAEQAEAEIESLYQALAKMNLFTRATATHWTAVCDPCGACSVTSEPHGSGSEEAALEAIPHADDCVYVRACRIIGEMRADLAPVCPTPECVGDMEPSDRNEWACDVCDALRITGTNT